MESQALAKEEQDQRTKDSLKAKKAELAKALEKSARKEPLKQSKLGANNNNQLQVDIYRDPAAQERWDEAVIDFMSLTYTSFSALEHLDILLKALFPNTKPKVIVRNRKFLSKQVTEKAVETLNKVYSIIQHIMKTTNSFAVTTDLWRSKSMKSFMSLTVHTIDENFNLVKMVF